MNTYIVLFMAPQTVIAQWMQTDQVDREVAEEKMRKEWDVWTVAHADMIKETKAGGKTKRITLKGVTDVKNDIMLYSIVEAESHESAAKAFEGHPHFGIPEASIEVMAIRSM